MPYDETPKIELSERCQRARDAKGRVIDMSYLDDPRVYFAAERTLLAWVRTGLALVGFGTLLGKQLLDRGEHSVLIMVLRIVLCGLGSAGNILAAVQFLRVLKTFSPQEIPPQNSAVIATMTALLSGGVGLVLIFYILFL